MSRTGWVSVSGPAVAIVILATVTVIACVAITGTVAATADPGIAAQQETPTSNNTTQHERPSDVNEGGDTAAVSAWLERRLSSQLTESSVAISQGEYERAQAVVGDEYDSRLDQYVEVAGETDSSDDDRAAQAYRETQETQQAYAATAQNYTDTYQQYQQARANGNETAARAAARRLERQSEQLTRLNESLTTQYEQIENLTGVDTTQAQQAVANQTSEVQSQQATVRTETFVETQLTVRTNRSTVAFDRPMGIVGQLRTANGSAVGNRSIRIAVGDRLYRVRTAANGTFQVAYRPVTLPVNASAVPVRYRPSVQAPYLGAETDVTADVRPVTPQLSVQPIQTSVGYGDRVPVRLSATAAGRPVPGLPVQIQLGARTAAGRTNATGNARLTLSVPASIEPGPTQLRVRQPRSGLAIAPATTQTPLTIESTPTTLNLTATRSTSVVMFAGRLQTTAGRGVPGQTVRVAVENGTVRSVVTNDTGWYRLTVPLNETTQTGDTNTSVSVLARFDGSGTNLASARAQTEFVRPATDGSSSGGDSLLWAALGVLILAAIVAGWWVRTRGDTARPEPTGTADNPEPTTTTDDTTTPWLEQAWTAVDDDETELAAVAAYAAVRDQLRQRVRIPAALTHREFVTVCTDEFEELNPALLQTVADAYEAATFAPTVDRETAMAAVEAADALLSESDSPADD